MRLSILCALISPFLATARLFAENAYFKSAWDSSTVGNAPPASVSQPGGLSEYPRLAHPNLELRKVPGTTASDADTAAKRIVAQRNPADPATYVHANINAPGIAFTPAYDTSSANSEPVTSFKANPVATQTSALSSTTSPTLEPGPAQVSETTTAIPQSTPPAPMGDDYVSTQWIETWIGGTSRTWVPHTFTVHFESRTPGPPPGKGQIGMGTIKGEAGKTKTILIGAAPTQVVGWSKGVAAAVGVGVVGLIV